MLAVVRSFLFVVCCILYGILIGLMKFARLGLLGCCRLTFVACLISSLLVRCLLFVVYCLVCGALCFFV